MFERKCELLAEPFMLKYENEAPPATDPRVALVPPEEWLIRMSTTELMLLALLPLPEKYETEMLPAAPPACVSVPPEELLI